MTQPVQEPSSDRELAAIGWRTRQLARRPAIASPDTPGPLASAYTVTFNGYDVYPNDWLQLEAGANDGPDWDEWFVNEAGQVPRSGESIGVLEPLLDNGGWIRIRPGGSDAFIVCSIEVTVGFSICNSGCPITPADDFYLGVGIEHSGSYGFGASPTRIEHVHEVANDLNTMMRLHVIEGFPGGSAFNGTDHFARVIAYQDDPASPTSPIVDGIYQARIVVQELCSFNLEDGLFSFEGT